VGVGREMREGGVERQPIPDWRDGISMDAQRTNNVAACIRDANLNGPFRDKRISYSLESLLQCCSSFYSRLGADVM
jgi:hypothetical protein